ncbi:hypothetical protein PHYC_02166 [Phycisphaerales bacterium]|nr:hypothetical protein PHYC_02166 [Phycisphaerales bacterium]
MDSRMRGKRVAAWFLGVAGVAASAGVANAQCTGFTVMPSSGGVIVPGTTDIGNHCDDCVTNVAIPFPVMLYGASYTAVNASSNGNLQFTTGSNTYQNACLPQGSIGVALCPQWDDLRTDGAGEGIFTSVSGVAPNRVFNIEWRTRYYGGGGTTNFEVRLFEDNSHFDVIYATVAQGGSSATVGAQHTTYPATQFACNAGGLTPGMVLTFNCTNGSIPPSGSGAATPSSIYSCGAGGTTLLTVNVTPGFNPASTGIGVTADLSSLAGSGTQTFYDDGTNGDVTPGNNVFSYQVTVPPSVTPGNKSVTFTVSDAEGRSSGGVFGLTVNPCPSAGPDVFVARLTDVGYYGVTGGITAYAIGTDACNAGDVPVMWLANNNQHPVIAQNMYRLKNGRFEQIGQSWLKHGFSSTNSGTCGACTPPPLGGQQLGVGCSDAYGSGLNGSQGNLGPRSQVNATTGAYPMPHGTGSTGTIGMRLQVMTADIDPAQNAGALYFGECQYVTADDAQWNNNTNPAINGLNNATHQRILIPTATSTPTLTATVQRMAPAIRAWKDADPAVSLVAADYVDNSVPGPGIVARFWVAGKATDNGDGTWHYEYAVFNLNSDRSGGGFTIPTGAGVAVSNVGFHGIFAHSGEPYPNTAANPDSWPSSVSGSGVTWSAPEPYLPPNGDNANALRWGTMYNFRFDANAAPVMGAGTIGLFKPGAIPSVDAAGIPIPGNGPCDPDVNCDGAVNGFDVEATEQAVNGDMSNFCQASADFNRDGAENGFDVEAVEQSVNGGPCP